MSLKSLDVPFLVLAAVLCSQTAAPQSSPSPALSLIAMCEDTDGCSNWAFQGNQGVGRWAAGSIANLTIEQLDASSVSIRRVDTAGVVKGLTALYTGARTGDWIEGTVTWSWPGHGQLSTGTTKWHALVAPKPKSTYSPSTATPWRVCEDFGSACGGADPPTHYLWALDGKLGNVRNVQDTYAAIGLVIDRFEPDSIVMRRIDLSGTFDGLTGIYTGTRQGNSMKGTATWIWPGHFRNPQTGNWVASISPKNCDQPGKDAFTALSAELTAQAAYMLADKPGGFRCNLRAAQLGDAEGENIVGSLYDAGDGTPRDYAQAFSWYQKSAQQGNLDAMNGLAGMYRAGHGTAVDLQKARYLADSAELAKRGKALIAGSVGGKGKTDGLNVLGNLLGYMVLGQAHQDAALAGKVAHEGAVIEHMNGGMARVKAEEIVFSQEVEIRSQEYSDCIDSHPAQCNPAPQDPFSNPNNRNRCEGVESAEEQCQATHDAEVAMNREGQEYLQCVRTYTTSEAIETHCQLSF